jgi:hypothetical protein
MSEKKYKYQEVTHDELLTLDLDVLVYRRPNMFIVNNNILSQIGVSELEKMFTIENYKCDGELTLYFPERFLNYVESQDLIRRIYLTGYSKVRIITHSAFIIQNTPNKFTRIVKDEKLQISKSFKLSNDKMIEPVPGLVL